MLLVTMMNGDHAGEDDDNNINDVDDGDNYEDKEVP